MIKKTWSKRLRRNVWRYDVRIGGRRFRDSFLKEEDCINALAAKRIEAQRRKYGLVAEESKPVTLAQLTAARIKDIMPDRGKATRTRRQDVRVLNDFLKQAPQGIAVERLAQAHLKSYADNLDLAPRTVNRHLAAIYAMLNAAGSYSIELDSYRPPKNPRRKVPARGRERLISDEEFIGLLAYLREPQRKGEHNFRAKFRHAAADAFEIALLTGRRRNEILSLRRDQINLPWQTLKIENTKTGTVQVLPLRGRLFSLIERRMKESAHPVYLFPDRYNRSHQKRMDGTLHEAARALGLPYGSKREGGFIFHDARHTATSSMLQDQTDISTVQDITGHSSKEMVMHYSHATRPSMERAMETLERRLSGVRLESGQEPNTPELPEMPEKKESLK